MGTLFKFIRSDFQKIKHTPIMWIHIIVPILISTLFVAYYTASPLAVDKVGLYIQVLSMGFPLIIGIVCAMAVEQEADAGNFQELLMARHKLFKFFSKLCMLLIMGLGSLIAAIGILDLGLELLVHENVFSAAFFAKITLILLFSEVFLYVLHLLCSFRFGSGASIGLGIVESLITALMITALGDRVWKWMPCSWGCRIPGYYITLKIDNGNHLFLMNEFQSGIYICLSATILLLLVSFLWYNYFEGRSEN